VQRQRLPSGLHCQRRFVRALFAALCHVPDLDHDVHLVRERDLPLRQRVLLRLPQRLCLEWVVLCPLPVALLHVHQHGRNLHLVPQRLLPQRQCLLLHLPRRHLHQWLQLCPLHLALCHLLGPVLLLHIVPSGDLPLPGHVCRAVPLWLGAQWLAVRPLHSPLCHVLGIGLLVFVLRQRLLDERWRLCVQRGPLCRLVQWHLSLVCRRLLPQPEPVRRHVPLVDLPRLQRCVCQLLAALLKLCRRVDQLPDLHQLVSLLQQHLPVCLPTGNVPVQLSGLLALHLPLHIVFWLLANLHHLRSVCSAAVPGQLLHRLPH